MPELQFRDPVRGRALVAALRAEVEAHGRPIALMHVCGSHEQAIARYGLRDALPDGLEVFMGPGCPVCITAAPEVDEAVALAERGIPVLTYGDMLRVPGTERSLADARARGAPVEVVYGAHEVAARARAADGPVVFFATGFETTAVATAAVLLADPPPNLLVLCAHKYVPPAMEAVASLPDSHIQGFLAAGHAATITGWGLFTAFAARHRVPVVVAGFEPLDILAGLLALARQVRHGRHDVVNAFPRCVTEHGNRVALDALWRVFALRGGEWRGIAHVEQGNLDLRPEWAAHDARAFFSASERAASVRPNLLAAGCRCGEIMTGRCRPEDCAMFGRECTPDRPVGACMVSSEGACRIAARYGGRPDLASSADLAELP